MLVARRLSQQLYKTNIYDCVAFRTSRVSMSFKLQTDPEEDMNPSYRTMHQSEYRESSITFAAGEQFLSSALRTSDQRKEITYGCLEPDAPGFDRTHAATDHQMTKLFAGSRCGYGGAPRR